MYVHMYPKYINACTYVCIQKDIVYEGMYRYYYYVAISNMYIHHPTNITMSTHTHTHTHTNGKIHK